MELNIPIQRGTKFKAALKLLNPFLSNLTGTEINIVSAILDMGIESISRANRSSLRANLKMGKFVFNNYIQNLKRKGVIVQTKDDLVINPRVVSLTKENTFTITFKEG